MIEREQVKEYLVKEEIARTDDIRGSVLIAIFLLAFITTPLALLKVSILPYGVLLIALVAYYGFIHKKTFDILINKEKSFNLFNHLQSVVNLFLITVLIHLTGGVESYFSFIYIFEIMISGFVLSWRESFLEASLAWMFYGIVLCLEYWGVLHHINIWPNMTGLYQDKSVILIAIVRMMVVFYMASFVAGYLNILLRKKGRQIKNALRSLSKMSLNFNEFIINDKLTGFYNYPYFKIRMADEFSKANFHKSDLALMIIDIDNFKDFASKYGGLNAEIALKKISGIIRNNIDFKYLSARTADDEFMILAPQTNSDFAFSVAEFIKDSVNKESFSVSKELSVPLTISVGIDSFPQEAATPDSLIDLARRALYVAKKSGKSAVYRYKKELEEN